MGTGRRSGRGRQLVELRARRAGTASMARTTGLIFALAGLMAGLVALRSGRPAAQDQLLLVEGVLALITGLVVLRRGGGLTFAQFRVLDVLGAVAAGVAVVLAGGGTPSLALATLTVLIACSDALFYPGRLAAVHSGFAALVVLAALVLPHPEQLVPGIVVVAVVAATGVVVGVLAHRAVDADTDPLTGLLNRRGLDRALEAELARAARADLPLTLVLLDLDRFKAVNDAGGHAAGDSVLREVAGQWGAELAPGQVLARTGGDEFVLVLPGLSALDGADVAERFRGAATRIGSSAGVATWRPGESASMVMGRADSSLYRSKAGGRHRTSVDAADGTALVPELRRAVTEGSIEVHYQVVVDLTRGGEVIGVEALARWTSSRGPVSPDEFIALAEAEGMIRELGAHVLERACRDAAVLVGAAGRPLLLTVNASGSQLADAGFPAVVARVLQRSGWPPSALVLEVTESQHDGESVVALAAAHALRDLGVRIAIDDFGTGFSTLARLDALTCDLLKLDRSFTSRIVEEGVVPPLLGVIAAIGDALQLPIIAEGVETAAQARTLTALGFPLAQGYLYGRPVPVDVLAAALAATTPGATASDPDRSGRCTSGPAASGPDAPGPWAAAAGASPGRPPVLG